MLWRDKNGHAMLGAKVENGKATQLSFNTIAPIMVFAAGALVPQLGLAAAPCSTSAWGSWR